MYVCYVHLFKLKLRYLQLYNLITACDLAFRFRALKPRPHWRL